MPIVHKSVQDGHWFIFSRHAGKNYAWQFHPDGDALRRNFCLKENDNIGRLFTIMLSRGLLYCENPLSHREPRSSLSVTDWEFLKTHYSDALSRIDLDSLALWLRLTDREKQWLAPHCKRSSVAHANDVDVQNFPVIETEFYRRHGLRPRRRSSRKLYQDYVGRYLWAFAQRCVAGDVCPVGHESQAGSVVLKELSSDKKWRLDSSVLDRFIAQIRAIAMDSKERKADAILSALSRLTNKTSH